MFEGKVRVCLILWLLVLSVRAGDEWFTVWELDQGVSPQLFVTWTAIDLWGELEGVSAPSTFPVGSWCCVKCKVVADLIKTTSLWIDAFCGCYFFYLFIRSSRIRNEISLLKIYRLSFVNTFFYSDKSPLLQNYCKKTTQTICGNCQKKRLQLIGPFIFLRWLGDVIPSYSNQFYK